MEVVLYVLEQAYYLAMPITASKSQSCWTTLWEVLSLKVETPWKISLTLYQPHPFAFRRTTSHSTFSFLIPENRSSFSLRLKKLQEHKRKKLGWITRVVDSPLTILFSNLRCYAEKRALGEVSSKLLDTQVNPAVWEMSGHIVLKRKEDIMKEPQRRKHGVFSLKFLYERRGSKKLTLWSLKQSALIVKKKKKFLKNRV